jgi:hypothetical protein
MPHLFAEEVIFLKLLTAYKEWDFPWKIVPFTSCELFLSPFMVVFVGRAYFYEKNDFTVEVKLFQLSSSLALILIQLK